MTHTTSYELGFNWTGGKDNIFIREIARAARRYRIRWVCVPKAELIKFRKRVDQGRVRIGVFLNTQADGVNLESPSLLLCRALKANNSLVIEDPDDVKTYADKALQLGYLQRAGLPVPKHYVIENFKRDKFPINASQRFGVGSKWVARSAIGLNRQLFLISKATSMTRALVKAGFKPGHRILVHRNHDPLIEGNRELRFRIWYLYGHVVPCFYQKGVDRPELLKAGDIGFPLFSRLIYLVKKIAHITLLDWFVSELVISGGHNKREVIIREPANALAGLGPGLKPLHSMPDEVMCITARRIVEIAWRYTKHLPLFSGIKINLGV